MVYFVPGSQEIKGEIVIWQNQLLVYCHQWHWFPGIDKLIGQSHLSGANRSIGSSGSNYSLWTSWFQENPTLLIIHISYCPLLLFIYCLLLLSTSISVKHFEKLKKNNRKRQIFLLVSNYRYQTHQKEDLFPNFR